MLFRSGNLVASTLLRKVNAGDFAGAAEQFLVWDKARVNGVLQPLAGLTRRRRAERALFMGQDWRASAAVGASRGRVAALGVLPVPEAPADQTVPKKTARNTPAKKPAAKKSAPTPRAQTTTPKAPPPAPTAKRPAPRKAR